MDNKHGIRSLRAFIGAKDYSISRSFYRDLGFSEAIISENMSLFTIAGQCFYLQDYYVKDWIENTMLFVELGDVDSYWTFLEGLDLDRKYTGIKLVPVQEKDWGRECLVIDPSGVLWHFAQFRE
jgi:hypothetical protein